MLHKPSISSQSSSVCDYDFDCAVGELLDYDETAMSCATVDYTTSFSDFGDVSERDHRYLTSLAPAAATGPHAEHGTVEECTISFDDDDDNDSGLNTSDTLPQYHPENAKRELLQYVHGSSDGRGQIPTVLLHHASEQWSNWADLCTSLETQLRRDGYHNAVVGLVSDEYGRRIMYSLRKD